MAEVDTSSYPKAAPPPDFLGQIQKIQGLKSGQLTIQKQHLDLMNQGYEYLNRELNSLGPNPTKDDFLNMGQNAVKLGLVQPDQWATVASQVSDDPTKNAALRDQVASKLMSTAEAANFHYGTPGMLPNGQQNTPVRQGPRGGPVAVGAPIQQQLPPDTPTVDENGQPALAGPQAPQLPAGATPAPGGIPGQIAPQGQTAPTNRLGAAVQAPQGQGGGYKAAGPNTAPSPLFEAGKAQLVGDQNTANERLTAIKPLQLALPKMKALATGPGTQMTTDVMAFLKANSIIPTSVNDPVTARQEVNKYLAQYVSRNGSRSDQDLAAKATSNPDPGTQINPALLELTKNTMAMDKMQAAMPGAFQGQDFSKYGQHRSTYPNQMDIRAFKLDTMEPAERAALIKDMQAKKNTPEGKKFWGSVNVADKQGLIDIQ